MQHGGNGACMLSFSQFVKKERKMFLRHQWYLVRFPKPLPGVRRQAGNLSNWYHTMEAPDTISWGSLVPYHGGPWYHTMGVPENFRYTHIRCHRYASQISQSHWLDISECSEVVPRGYEIMLKLWFSVRLPLWQILCLDEEIILRRLSNYCFNASLRRSWKTCFTFLPLTKIKLLWR